MKPGQIGTSFYAQEFVDRVAYEALEQLDAEEKNYIFRYPDSTTHHFGIGLWIRNKYIHGKDLGFEGYHPDNLSSKIISRIASLLIDNYDYDNPFYGYLYGDSYFGYLRRLYHAVTGEYPDALMDGYAGQPDAHEAAKEVKKRVKAVVLDTGRFKKLCKKYGLTDAQYREYKKFADAYNKENWRIIPYDIAILASKELEPEERQKQLRVMKSVLDESPCLALEIPAFVWNQRDSVLLAVGAYGRSLQRFGRFNADDEIIRTALSDDGEAIQYVKKELRDNPDYIRLALSDKYGTPLKMRCMIPYRDSEEWVRIALEANGRNIQWASPRLRDDFETAAFAIRHQKNYYPDSTVCNLSTRLRDNLEIALLDIKEGHACVDDYSRRLRDSDEVAQALIESDHKWKIYMMSKRVRKKYGEDE